MTERDPRQQGPLMSSVEKLRQELDHWIEAAVSQGERALDAFGMGTAWSPAVDVIETTETVEILADLPGIDPQNVDVTLAGNMLTLKGEKPAVETKEDAVVHLGERRSGSFARSIPLPVPVKPDEVTAEAKDGVLRILLMKADQAKPTQIPVKSPERHASQAPNGSP